MVTDHISRAPAPGPLGSLRQKLGRLRLWHVPAFAFLAACAVAGSSYDIETLEQTAQFGTTPNGQVWALPQGRIISLERNLSPEYEQKIGLRNDTTLPGDNFLWLRARVPSGYPAGQFRLVDFMERAGEVPSPFQTISDNDLRTGYDALGTYFYLIHRTGGETNCVLAFRRIESGLRVMPRGTSVMEVLLRNCVRGAPEQALGPITAAQIGFPGTTLAVNADTGSNRNISPLAAPLLD